MLFNEPKLLKSNPVGDNAIIGSGFSALQRAEIAEIVEEALQTLLFGGFSALQRAEIAEMHRQRAHT